MPVYYDSKQIIPAPFVAIRREETKDEDGTPIGNNWSITVQGKLVAHKGSPNSTGTFHTSGGYPPDEVLTPDQCLRSLLKKQEALQELFCNHGRSFEIQPLDGSAPTKFNPRIISVDFPEGKWTKTADYTIQMEADVLYLAGDPICGGAISADNPAISRSSEEWNLETGDENGVTYRLTHNVSATGKRSFNESGGLVAEAWVNAKNFVLNQIGLGLKPDRMTAPDVLDANSLQAFNYTRVQVVGERQGTFSVTETWLCYDPGGEPPAVDEFTVNARLGQDGLSNVSVEGQVRGLEVRDNNTYAFTSTRYANALSKWNTYVFPFLHDRAEAATGLTLNPVPLSRQSGFNETSGVITYNWEFNDRPAFFIAGAISENITITNSGGTDVYASLPVLGRPFGPVLQSVATITSRKRTIAIEAQLAAANQVFTPVSPNTNALVLLYTPIGTQVFLDDDTESFSQHTGRYTRNVAFTWQ